MSPIAAALCSLLVIGLVGFLGILVAAVVYAARNPDPKKPSEAEIEAFLKRWCIMIPPAFPFIWLFERVLPLEGPKEHGDPPVPWDDGDGGDRGHSHDEGPRY